MSTDQSYDARRCADLHTARILDPVIATPEDVRSTASAVLADQRYRGAAERIQAEINALPGPESIVPLLEQLH
jgi:UDP:flavonoid glycosyltransferase YjiC (YdhE family)